MIVMSSCSLNDMQPIPHIINVLGNCLLLVVIFASFEQLQTKDPASSRVNKEKMFWVFSVISLFTAKQKNIL